MLDYYQIRSSFRRQGHGRNIMAFLAAWYKQGGTQAIRVTNETSAGKFFYQKCGFKCVDGLGWVLDTTETRKRLRQRATTGAKRARVHKRKKGARPSR